LLDDDVKFDADVSLCGGDEPSSLLIMYHLAPYPSRTLTSKTHTPVGSPCVLNQTAFQNDKVKKKITVRTAKVAPQISNNVCTSEINLERTEFAATNRNMHTTHVKFIEKHHNNGVASPAFFARSFPFNVP
jgi:hypothetical protein